MVEDEYIPLMVEVQEERFDKVERDPGRKLSTKLHLARECRGSQDRAFK
jgi:hypothetical protein